MLSTDKLHDSMTPFMYHIFTIQAFHSLQKEKNYSVSGFLGNKIYDQFNFTGNEPGEIK